MRDRPPQGALIADSRLIYNRAEMDRSSDWFAQAQDDLLWARDTLQAGRWAQACFVCQQVGEKALKALALRRGSDQVRSHSMLEIAQALDIDDEVALIAMRLDQYYIGTRYPDAFPSGAPFQYYSEEQASEAVSMAERIAEIVAGLLEDAGD